MCLGIRDSHWARKKDQLLSSEGQEILSDESCLLRKRDRSRGLAVHCLLERKNWKCVIKREENIKIPETEKLWLGGPMCKKKKLSKRQIDEVSAVKGIIIWDSEIWFCIYSGLLYFRQVLQTPKYHRHKSFILSLLPAKQQTLSRAGRSAGLCWKEFPWLSRVGVPESMFEILYLLPNRREGCSSGLHCNSGILGSNSKALNGFVSRPSPFLTDGEIGLNTELMAKLRLAQASSSYKTPKQHQIGKSLSNSDKSFR